MKLSALDFIFYNTEWSLKISLEIQRNSVIEFLKHAFRDPKLVRLLGKEAKVNWIKESRMNNNSWFTVIFRDIPYFVTKENIEVLCKQENETVLFVGPKTKIKGVDCCLVRFASLEDAESACNRLHNLPLKFEGERYILKVFTLILIHES